MKNWYKFNDVFYHTFLKVFVPQRKVGKIFKIKGKKYRVVKVPNDSKLGCFGKGDRCSFSNNCNSVCILKRGFCYHAERKDKMSVCFIKIEK